MQTTMSKLAEIQKKYLADTVTLVRHLSKTGELAMLQNGFLMMQTEATIKSSSQ